VTPEQLHVIGIAWAKLVGLMTTKQDELRRLQAMQGSGYGRRLPRMVKLADEIESLKARIERAERLQQGD
jgi:hypothetical protein